MHALVVRRSMSRTAASNIASTAAFTPAASPTNVRTLRLWSASSVRCSRRTPGVPATPDAISLMISGRRPSLMLGMHSDDGHGRFAFSPLSTHNRPDWWLDVDVRRGSPLPSESGALAGDCQALIEQLLLAGLDHYFSGRFEEAIHVWTRVFFLDRGHARARAYIERARGAVAERQREAEAQIAEDTLRLTQSAAVFSTASSISAGMTRSAVELSRSEGPRRFTRRDLLRRSADQEPAASLDPPPRRSSRRR